jgi:serine protease Do
MSRRLPILDRSPMTAAKIQSILRSRVMFVIIVVCSLCLPPLPADAQQSSARTASRAAAPDSLHQLNSAIENLVQRISPAVVQIVSRGYRPSQSNTQGQADVVVGRQQAVGSGVIVDPSGYIVTNAHVVNGAQQIEVVVSRLDAANSSAIEDAPTETYQARVVGVTKELDLAVLKIEAKSLSAVPFAAGAVAKQGEMVFAFGSPEGLRNTVTMGVISSVARQPDPDSPLVYVQTDTPINPGNSGGPLVNADGELVGINTFILSVSGGSQGLGFAIPASLIAYAYPQLLKYGHIHQPEIGALIQTITPELAAGMHLAKDRGLIVSDVLPGGPADTAGLRVQDIVVDVDGAPAPSLPMFAQSLYMNHGTGDRVKIDILRGNSPLRLEVPLIERPHKADGLLDVVDPVKNLVRSLGILGIAITPELLQNLPELRQSSGVVVAAKTVAASDRDIPLQTGDIIHALNGVKITDLDGLRTGLDQLKPGDPVALWVERYGQLIFVSFQI